MSEELFHIEPEPGDPSRPIAELAAIHRDGHPLLTAAIGVDPADCIVRIRSADDLALDATRRYQVTIRYETAGHKMADEWARFQNGEVSVVAYGFLARNPDRITDYVVLDAERLREDMTDRPTCQITATNSRSFVHHAPGGAGFVVVDVRRLRPETVRVATFHINHDTAPVTVQQGMF